ncbi:pyridoxamine 5'-phosphate oxidase family protein [Paraburkholderia sp. CNPSo 3076]|uniref:pyridoxamine 5'-phosphate oxidase family protein n=1 Tax=Paraburkholderia sp. CNPSo 3076 TaxID=2940936 RepID=UPI0022536F25|nr:pyridoxamine 5'-phosphate oxidase family protein [Paraburkholderia sp. CNPSo 3076]MCX5539919.1 pyridoxamine 5'-phosphate oxidase family protein [Paraburkholderia sp. CNPSo 3076]
MSPNDSTASTPDRILRYPSDIAFTPTVKAMQERLGSRELYASVERDHAWGVALTPKIQEFIAAQTSVFLGTANTEGQPYIQHRGGPAGFLHVVDEHTIAFADFIGNQQYITLGNLADNPKAHLFVIDYARRRRVKIWGRARVVEDPALVEELMPAGYKARAERVIVFTVHAWDMNCPQHIPQRFEAADVKSALDERDARIRELKEVAAQREVRVRELETEVARLREGAAA